MQFRGRANRCGDRAAPFPAPYLTSPTSGQTDQAQLGPNLVSTTRHRLHLHQSAFPPGFQNTVTKQAFTTIGERLVSGARVTPWGVTIFGQPGGQFTFGEPGHRPRHTAPVDLAHGLVPGTGWTAVPPPCWCGPATPRQTRCGPAGGPIPDRHCPASRTWFFRYSLATSVRQNVAAAVALNQQTGGFGHHQQVVILVKHLEFHGATIKQGLPLVTVSLEIPTCPINLEY